MEQPIQPATEVAADPEQYQRYLNFMAEQGQPVEALPVEPVQPEQAVINPEQL
jgi:hypothetical protein